MITVNVPEIVIEIPVAPLATRPVRSQSAPVEPVAQGSDASTDQRVSPLSVRLVMRLSGTVVPIAPPAERAFEPARPRTDGLVRVKTTWFAWWHMMSDHQKQDCFIALYLLMFVAAFAIGMQLTQ